MDKSKLNYQKNLLLIIVVLFWFSQYVYVPFQTPYLSTMQVSSSMIGIIIGIYGFSQMVLRMPIGIMADKNGRHKLFIILGVTASALASVFRIILESQTGFLVGNILSGFASAMADKNGRHKLFIILGVTASALASVFRIILESQTGFLVGNILSGFASAMWISFMVLYASYFTCENLQRAMGLIMAANNIGVLGGFVLSTLSYNYLGMNFLCLLSICSGVPAILLSFGIKEQKTKTVKIVPKTSDLIKVYADLGMNFLCLLSICSGVPAILLSFGIKEQKTKTVKIVPKTSDLIKVYADKRLIFFSILALVQQGILMATCMSFTTQIAHEINASAFQIGLLSIVYIIVAVLASYFSASNFARRLGSSLWIPFILFVLAIYCFAVPNIFSPNLLIAIQILAGLSTGIVFSFCTSEAMKNVPIEKRSTAMGYYQAIYAVGMTIVPMIAGNIAEIYNLNIAFYLEGIIAVVATVASMIYFKYDNRKTIKG